MSEVFFILCAVVASIAFASYLDSGDEVMAGLALFNALFAIHWSRRTVTR